MSFANSRLDGFLRSIPTASLESGDTASRCKFNFSYFTVANGSQDFSGWDHPHLCKMLSALKEYSGQPLSYWEHQSAGKVGTVLAVYGKFPSRSDFKHPAHVPHDVMWARFRLQRAVRLVGFTVPKSLRSSKDKDGYLFDCNTFYVVFFDANHQFYKSEKP